MIIKAKLRNLLKIIQEKLNQSDQVPSYHNLKVQGNVESSDHVLREKIYYDMSEIKKPIKNNTGKTKSK